jgi:hypothetical protein
MSTAKMVGIVLMVLGGLAVVYGGFFYTDTHTAKIGGMELSVKEKDFFSVPVWVGLAGLVAGAFLMFAPKR